MCGFVTFINFGNKTLLGKATKILSHRGPDNQGIFWDEKHNCGLGHRRLSIIDLSIDGNQPMWTENQRYAIVFNGEIYNYLELKDSFYKKGITFRTKTDTEVILEGYKLFGENIIEKLNGNFSFVIYDSYTGDIFCGRDHLGVKPFYYYMIEDSMIIASEIKSIIPLIDNLSVDIEALATPVHFQTAPLTGFKNIKKLGPGSFMTFKNGILLIKKYWSIVNQKENYSANNYEYILDDLINDAVSKQMVSDVPIGVLLSGGLDSSLIAALMSKNTNGIITSFNIKISKNDLKQQGIVDDSIYAQQVAKKFNFNHQEILIEPDIINLLPKLVYHLDELTVDPAAINSFLIAKSAKEAGISVLLSGVGADEIFGGYRAHRALNGLNQYGGLINNSISRWISNLLHNIPDNIPLPTKKLTRWMKKIFYLISLPAEERHVLVKDAAIDARRHNMLFRDDFKYPDLNHIAKEKKLFLNSNSLSYLNKVCLSDTSFYLPDHNLQYLDKSMMAAGVEARPPLVDYRIVEFAFSINDEQKINNGSQKYLLKNVAKKYLDYNIINRPKAPFAAPLRSWIKNELNELISDYLSHERISKRGIFNADYVEHLRIEDSRSINDHSQLIFRILMTEIWFETFIDNKLKFNN